MMAGRPSIAAAHAALHRTSPSPRRPVHTPTNSPAQGFKTVGATGRDPVGNDADWTGGTTNPAGTLQIDTITPQLTSIVATDTSPTNAGTVHYTVTFSEAVTGVDASDFTLVTNGISGA